MSAIRTIIKARPAALLCALLWGLWSLAPAAAAGDELKLTAEGFPVYLARGEALTGALSVNGGEAPYTVEAGGETFTLAAAGRVALRFPTGQETGAEMALGLRVTDGAGRAASCPLTIPLIDAVAPEPVPTTGDRGLDLLLAAVGQLGYSPDEGGWTIYGAWTGEPYAPWGAAFVAYCLQAADIGPEILPRAESAAAWIRALGRDFIAAGAYQPKHGDLAFVAGDPGEGPRVGVVSHVWNRTVSVIGAVDGAVRDTAYPVDNGGLIGYADVTAACARAVQAEAAAEDEAVPPEPAPYFRAVTAETAGDCAILRAAPAGEVVAVAEKAGTPVRLTGRAGYADGAAWYAARIGRREGVIRTDQVAADAPYEPQYGKTLGGGVAVREDPDVESAEIARFDTPGTELQVIGRGQGADRYVWFAVVADGRPGWVRGDLFEPYHDPTPAAVDPPTTETRSYENGRLVVYTADENGTIVRMEVWENVEKE